jgi:hypothetical protein
MSRIAQDFAFGCKGKVMHINPGGHTGIPVTERETW